MDDENASNKRAVMMPGDHFEWATSWSVEKSIALLEPSDKEKAEEPPVYHVYAYVRCDASVDDGPAMELGVYDEKDKKNVSYKKLAVSEIKGTDYQQIDLGSLPLTSSMYVWFAPPKRPNEVQAVYIDQIVVIREK
ncbi:MAG: hypothetical protein J6X44_05630 [Thermoguttaceae bacterium]|nr:hypothetical protein [Thermoguttaceae bacterium]